LKEEIRNIVLESGADVCGFANIDRFADTPEGFSPTDIYEGCQSVVVLGLALPHGLSEVDPRFIYGYFNELGCSMLDGIILKVARAIERDFGGIAVPLPSDSPVSFWDEETKTARGILSMKHAAVAAGVGFMGKNTLLINQMFGNQLTVGAVLLSLNLPSDELCVNLCPPKCRKCIDNCPVHAINENETVNQELCREYTYKTTFGGIGTVECNKCRMGCPLRFGLRSSN
jgi:epoxyqueuosine reductase QueG